MYRNMHFDAQQFWEAAVSPSPYPASIRRDRPS